MPASTAATNATPAPTSTRAGRSRRAGAGSTCACPARAPRTVTAMPVSSAVEGRGDRLGEVGDPRTPPGGDVVVALQHPALLHGGYGVERRTLGDGVGALVAADRVGQDDQIRARADHVLRRQLRVAGLRAGRLVR